MGKRFLLLIPIILILIIGYLFYSFYNFVQPSAEIKGHKFQVEVVTSEKDKEIGLSKHNTLALNHGMLFLFDKPELYAFWMKGMKFPLDIIFIRNNKIVTLYKSLPINNLTIYPAREPSDKVLEINAGLSEKYGIKVGDTVTIKNIK